MLFGRPTLKGGIWAVDDSIRPVVSVFPRVEGPLPIFLSIPDGRVAFGAPLVPAGGCPGDTLA